MTGSTLETAQPEPAAFGAQRLRGGVAYLATVRADGAPRLHPVTPIIGAGRLWLFMEPSSPKGDDLHRSGRYALHCLATDDPALRALAVASASYTPADRYVLFELTIERALATMYTDGEPVRQRWRAD